MDINEQTGYTGNNSNDIMKFKDFNPINKGTIDAMNKIGQVHAKDLHGVTKDILDPEDDSEVILNDEEEDDLVINADPELAPHFWSHPYGFQGAPMAIGDSISEAHGVPDDLDPWVNLLFAFIKNQIYVFVEKTRNTDEHDIELEIDGETVLSKSLVIFVKDGEFNKYIKAHIPKDNKMKVKNLEIDLNLATAPDDLVNTDTWHASFSDSKSTMRGKVYTDVNLMFDLILPEKLLEFTEADDIDNLLYETNLYTKIIEFLAHELTHMYEYYHRKLNNIEVWKDRLLNTNKYAVEKQLLSKVSADWIRFLDLIYLSLDFEINARISQLFYYLVEHQPNTKYDFMDKVKSSGVWKEMKQLKDFDAETFYNTFEYKSSDEDLKGAFIQLKLYTEEELENADMKHILFKELIKIWDKVIDDETNKLYDSGEMRRLSPFYLNNPMVFLRRFEKRFHSKAKTWERKIFRLSSKFDLE